MTRTERKNLAMQIFQYNDAVKVADKTTEAVKRACLNGKPPDHVSARKYITALEIIQFIAADEKLMRVRKTDLQTMCKRT